MEACPAPINQNGIISNQSIIVIRKIKTTKQGVPQACS